jgi:hypothetical protein
MGKRYAETGKYIENVIEKGKGGKKDEKLIKGVK